MSFALRGNYITVNGLAARNCLIRLFFGGNGTADPIILFATLLPSHISCAMVRGASFDREIDNMIANRLGENPPKHIHAACERLEAVFHDHSHADLCADFYFLPYFPLRLNLWFADDEFPASGKLLINDGVKHCLGTEAIGTVGALLIQKLCEECESL